MNGQEGPEGSHLPPDDLASYLDRTASPPDRERMEAHLALCSACRRELATVSALLRASPGQRRPWAVLGPALAAAAAVALVFLWPENGTDVPGAPLHRDVPGLMQERPGSLSPAGPVPTVESFRWSPAEGADRYQLTLYDDAGQVLWRSQTDSTLLSRPDSILLEAGRLYLWRVEARIGIDRWVESELSRFTISPNPGRPPNDSQQREGRPP